MQVSLWQALLVVFGLVGCSSSAFRGKGYADESRLDVLTSFSLALSKRNYREAARYLAPEDRARLAGPEDGILPEYRDRIRAIRRTTLLNNPLIEVSHGRIHGIPDVLPVLALGDADTSEFRDFPDSLADEAVQGESPQSKDRDKEQAELKRTSGAFFRAVSRRDWKKAMAFLHAQERADFLDAAGKMKREARQRLAGVDTSAWEALALRDGKLTGIVLIIPASGDQPVY